MITNDIKLCQSVVEQIDKSNFIVNKCNVIMFLDHEGATIDLDPDAIEVDFLDPIKRVLGPMKEKLEDRKKEMWQFEAERRKARQQSAGNNLETDKLVTLRTFTLGDQIIWLPRLTRWKGDMHK